MTKVIAVRCTSYDEEEIYRVMRNGVDALGGLHSLVPGDARVLVKPNYLSYADPDKAVTTHPAVIKAMLRMLHEDGYCAVTFGDSPGHGSNAAISERLGVASVAGKYGAVPADMETEVAVSTGEGATANVLYLCKGVTEADAIISLCKMKTHQLERITGAVKNVYGFVCGARKATGHVKYPNASVFAGVLTDIHKATNIRLHIMDGVLAMEGNGPASGEPVKMNVMLFATDPVALDTVFCSLINLDPKLVPTCTQGQVKGIGTCDMNEIEIVAIDVTARSADETSVRDDTDCAADTLCNAGTIDTAELKKRFGKNDFNVNRESEGNTLFVKALDMIDAFTRRPVINKDLCVHCGICVNHCPVPGKAVDFKKGRDKPPVYDYHKCIRCYCCQEMCPQKAISVRRGL